jgi:hypothetical protein
MKNENTNIKVTLVSGFLANRSKPDQGEALYRVTGGPYNGILITVFTDSLPEGIYSVSGFSNSGWWRNAANIPGMEDGGQTEKGDSFIKELLVLAQVVEQDLQPAF